jgi:hypothetical protein
MVLPFTDGGSTDADDAAMMISSLELDSTDEEEMKSFSQPSVQQKMPLL